MDDYIDALGKTVLNLNPFEKSTNFIKACRYRKEAIAAGSALYYISNFLDTV
jgi:hypothetical protein